MVKMLTSWIHFLFSGFVCIGKEEESEKEEGGCVGLGGEGDRREKVCVCVG